MVKVAALFVFVVACIVGSNQVAGEWTIDANSHYEKLADILHSFPHFTFSGGVQDNVQFNTSQDYWESLIMLAVPFAVVAVLVLLAGIIAIVAIGCCRCSRSTNSSASLFIVKILRLFLGLAVLGLCAGGIYGTIAIHESVPYVIDKADNSASLIINRADVVYADVLKVQQFIPDVSELAQLLNTAHSYEDDLNDVSDPSKQAEVAEFILSLVLYGIIISVTVLSMLAGCFRWGRILLGLSFFGWVGLLIIWVVCGAFLSGSVATADVCETDNQYLINEFLSSASLEANIVEHYILCNGSEILQELDSAAQSLIGLATSELQQAKEGGNQTQIDYWSGVLNDSLILYADFQILESCTDTYNNVNDSKKKVCTEFLVGAFVVMSSLFFIGVLGIAVWLLGILEWKLESVSGVEFLEAEYDAGGLSSIYSEKTPLVEFNARRASTRRERNGILF